MRTSKTGLLRALVLASVFASFVALAFALSMPVEYGEEARGDDTSGLSITPPAMPVQPAMQPPPGAVTEGSGSAGAEAVASSATSGAIEASRGRGASVVILDYHTFLGKKGDNLDFPPAELASQLDAMAALGYRFVSLEDAIEGRIEGKANIAITIDDGNHSVYRACREVLLPKGIRPTLFIYPAIVLSRQPFALTPEKVAELARDGCIIGAHGYHHIPLSDKSRRKNPKDYWSEITLPAQALSRITGHIPLLFAYPYGIASPQAEKDLAAADYEWAFTADADFGPVDFAAPDLDHMAVHRTIVYRWNYPKILKALADHLRD